MVNEEPSAQAPADHQPSEPTPQPGIQERHRSGAPLWTVLIAVATSGLVGLGSGIAIGSGRADGGGEHEASDTSRLQAARNDCAEHSPDIRVGDDGESLMIDRAGADEDPGADITDLACVLAYLDVPDSIIGRIDSTRALDGMQTADWDGLNTTWTYHPDDGVNMILEESRQRSHE